jgi:hypothetical protein
VNVGGLALPPDVMPIAAILRTLQSDSTDFTTRTLPLAVSMGAALVEYGRTSTQKFEAIVTLLDNQANAGIVVQHLEELQAKASAGAAAAVNASSAMADYSNKVAASLSALDAFIKTSPWFNTLGDLAQAKNQVAAWTAQIEEMTRQLATYGPDDPGRTIVGIQLESAIATRDTLNVLIEVKSLHLELQAQLGTAMPGLQHAQAAWNAVAIELQQVTTFAREAGARALKDVPCLAQVELATAASEWQAVADDAQNFVDTYLRAAGS